MTMSELKHLSKVLLHTWDGRSVVFWVPVFLALLVRSITNEGFAFEKIKYLLYPLVLFLIFLRFRERRPDPERRTNLWGFFNVHGFGLFLSIYIEFLK